VKIQDFKTGFGFIVEGVSFNTLCDCLAKISGVEFRSRQRFFLSGAGIHGEFIFQSEAFKIETWEMDDSLFVSLKNKNAELAALIELRKHIEQFCGDY